MFGSVMCSFMAFLSCMECQASRISLSRHTDSLSTIWTLSLVTVKHTVFGQQTVFIQRCYDLCVLSRVFLGRTMSDQRKHNHNLYIWTCLSFDVLSMFQMERIGLWATWMLKTRRTFVTLSENSLAGQPRSIQSMIILLNALSKAIFMRSTYLRALPN